MSLSLTIFISVLLGVNRGQVHLLHIQSEKCILQRTVDRKTASNMKLFLCLTALAALYCAVESRYSEYEFVLFTFDKHFNRFYLKKKYQGTGGDDRVTRTLFNAPNKTQQNDCGVFIYVYSLYSTRVVKDPV